MTPLRVLNLLATLCCAHASVIGGLGLSLVGPGEPGILLQGPSAKGTVLGPDGGLISGGAIGGTVLAGPKAGGIVSSVVSKGVIAPLGPIAVGAPVLSPIGLGIGKGAIIAGPSGTVVTNGIGPGLIGANIGIGGPIVGGLGGPLIGGGIVSPLGLGLGGLGWGGLGKVII